MTAQNSIPAQPSSSPNGTAAPHPAYRAARNGAALFDRSAEGRLRLTGADRMSWLQGLLTNDIAALTPGRGCYAAYLTPQGRMISDVRVLTLPDAFLLDLPASTVSPVRDRFEMFVITEDVGIEDVTTTLARLGIHGPRAAACVAQAIGPLLALGPAPAGAAPPPADAMAQQLSHLGPHASLTLTVPGPALALQRAETCELVVAGAQELGEAGFDVYTAVDAVASLRARLQDAGAIVGDDPTWNLLRLEAGTPVFGVDMDDTTIPLEAGLEQNAISFTKGCYVGQEVIVRVTHRGHGRVARRLVGLVMPGVSAGDAADSLAPGVSLLAPGDEEREIGRITSAALSPALGRPIALGYVHRDFVEPGTTVCARASSGTIDLEVVRTPFVRSTGSA